MFTALRLMSGSVFIRPVGSPVPIEKPDPGHAFWGFAVDKAPNELVLVETKFEIVPTVDPTTKEVVPQPVDFVMAKIGEVCEARKITLSGPNAIKWELAIRELKVVNGIRTVKVHDAVPGDPCPLTAEQKKVISDAGGMAALTLKLETILADRMPKMMIEKPE
jgi:hypothetical protein